ncbi:DUF5808 domain-containing protein [Halodesulfurarchaeum sp. HSR-GB]|uniref:DUF5808 domain-containing protein n=1 Tax=Halodesulfurarchaeum sp. HSR-GB TaxID=3074077 RepID=UPI00285EABF1|nr:DUF5808 domain-containing protein [Halodesulfurarchaeum sp. HSR-GB]MDR5656295.1 DUF5808 domain-containing protein [Halodesulfurarchaeum sp. HSR-GB]
MTQEASGKIFGIPYNFERPSLKRLLSAYWQPGKGMIAETPFGIGYTLNLANWRSWLVLGVAAALVFQERKGEEETEEAVDVVIEE